MHFENLWTVSGTFDLVLISCSKHLYSDQDLMNFWLFGSDIPSVISSASDIIVFFSNIIWQYFISCVQ